MASPDVDLIEMTDPAIARGDSDVFELYVHVVLGYDIDTKIVSVASQDAEPSRKHFGCGVAGGGEDGG